MDNPTFLTLIRELASLPRETEWLEFKHNNSDPADIGEYISAISNSAALHGRPRGYVIWGVKDGTHDLVGTSFRPHEAKVSSQELENWLVGSLYPQAHFKIYEGSDGGRHFVAFEIAAAAHTPVRFKDFEYVRVGTYKKKLRDHPEIERKLWSVFQNKAFEDDIALDRATSEQVLQLLDYPEYFRLTQQPLPENRSAIIAKFEAERLILRGRDDRFEITNLGAILFARQLGNFGRVARKALRVIIYKGANRIETIKEQNGSSGYAIGFEGAIRYINDQLPQNEQIGQALRREVRMYPELAVRELVANALIHQDLTITGAGPTVEVFADRMEITNPGVPLIDPLRFIDEPPRSRNETLASLMRRMAMCEERGSGIDKVISSIEEYQLPAPDFRVTQQSTVAILLGPRDFAAMDRPDRVRACYQHACLWYVSGKRITNASLRQRLGIKVTNYPVASRVLRDAQDAKLIKPYAPNGEAKKDISYVPYWA
ncbi:MAG TPA: ATP-binding protein [Tepidisphaeraceae bacterium]|nr:ATP-binding protein [Tepidisphaeraceae bacterium]